MGELLLDRDAEVAQCRVAQPVHVEEKIVEVDPFGSVRRTGAASPFRDRARLGPMARERLFVMLVLAAVVLPARRPDERRVQVADRIVLLAVVRIGARGRPRSVELSPEVRVDGFPRIL